MDARTVRKFRIVGNETYKSERQSDTFLKSATCKDRLQVRRGAVAKPRCVTPKG